MPRKRRASAADTATNPPNELQTRHSARLKKTTTSLCGFVRYFDKLPTEIIYPIWEYSREPALIHTCQRMHELLPSYVGFTKCMAALAIVVLLTEDEDFDGILHDVLFPIPGIEKLDDKDKRAQIQEEVFSSYWFDHHHLQLAMKGIPTAVRSELFSSTYLKGPFSLSRGQQQNVDRFPHNVDPPDPHAERNDFVLRAQNADGQVMSINCHHNHLLFSLRDRPTISTFITEVCYIFDSFLQTPITTAKHKAIKLTMEARNFWTPRGLDMHHVKPGLKCSRDCLGAAFLDIVSKPYTNDVHDVFRTLLYVEHESFQRHNEESVIGIEMLKAAAMIDDADWVYYLLYEMRQMSEHVLEDRPWRTQWTPTTEEVKCLSRHLLEYKPNSNSRDLLLLELEARELVEKAARSTLDGRATRSERCPFIVDTFLRGQHERKTPSDFGRRLARIGLYQYEEYVDF